MFSTFVEQKTRLYTGIKIPDRTSKSMQSAIKQVAYVLPKNPFKTATVNMEKDFRCYSRIEEHLDIKIYFANPYSS